MSERKERPMKIIRKRLGFSQADIAAAIGCTQGNVSFYERGQTIPPEVARKLIAVARRNGLMLTFDMVYGAEEVDT